MAGSKDLLADLLPHLRAAAPDIAPQRLAEIAADIELRIRSERGGERLYVKKQVVMTKARLTAARFEAASDLTKAFGLSTRQRR